MIADTIIRAGEGTPTNIVLYVPPDASLAFPPVGQNTTIYLTDGTLLSVGEVFPDVGGGLATGSILFNIETGEPYVYIVNPLILKV